MRKYFNYQINKVITVKNLITIEYLDISSSFSYPEETHDFYEFTYVDSGKISCVIDGEEMLLSQGDFLLIPPQKKHCYYAAKGTPAEKSMADPSFKNMFRNAPVVIFIGCKSGKYTPVDCGLMAENMMLAAQSLGLGTVCMGGPIGFFLQPAGEPLLKSLAFSEGYEPLICIGIGYADEAPEAKPRNKEVIKYIE